MGELAEVAGEAHLGGTYVDGVLPSSPPDQGALSSRLSRSRSPCDPFPTSPIFGAHHPPKKVFLKREKKSIPPKNQLERKKRKGRNDSLVIPFLTFMNPSIRPPPPQSPTPLHQVPSTPPSRPFLHLVVAVSTSAVPSRSLPSM
jgi:hypothetical protein